MDLDSAAYNQALTAARLRLGVVFDEGAHPRGLHGEFRAKHPDWLPKGAKLTHTVVPHPEWGDEGVTQHQYRVTQGGKQIAMLDVNTEPGLTVVESVEVDKVHQRKGVARGLFAKAREDLGEIKHSEWQTGEGHAWSKAVGGARSGDPSTWTTDLPTGRVIGPLE